MNEPTLVDTARYEALHGSAIGCAGLVKNLADAVAALTAENERLRENEHTLRMGWWLSHGCSGLYGDDGEMHCGQCMIDFKRDDPRDIETRIKNANMLKVSLKLSRAALPSTRETTDG